jgi:hypothetical protein
MSSTSAKILSKPQRSFKQENKIFAPVIVIGVVFFAPIFVFLTLLENFFSGHARSHYFAREMQWKLSGSKTKSSWRRR